MTLSDNELLTKYKEVVEGFKTFCSSPVVTGIGMTADELEYLGEQPFDNIYFHDLSLGFFIAKNVLTIDAFKLAMIV